MTAANPRLGIALGRSRLVGVVIDGQQQIRAERIASVPSGDYQAVLAAIADVVQALEAELAVDDLATGVAVPGFVSAATGRVYGAHTDWLDGRPFTDDLAARLGRTISVSSRAGCLARGEYRHGAADNAGRVFAAVLGTSVSGALMIDGDVVGGPGSLAGAWGHVSLPWPSPAEARGAPACACGLSGCIDAWLSAPGMVADHRRRGGHDLSVPDIVARAEAGERLAGVTLRDWLARSARALAMVVNMIDPDTIVVGGGLSRIPWLYSEVPKIWGRHCAADRIETRLLPAAFGDTAIARGAALL